jgi:peptidoglycan hydrolase-like protein with peptidoglycan-binding domain
MPSNNSSTFQTINYKPKNRVAQQHRNDSRVYPAQLETQSLGKLQVNVTSTSNNRPIENATIKVSVTGDATNNVIEELKTNVSGKTSVVDLPAPPLEYSLTPASPMPYAEYTFTITAPGYEPIIISGAEILPVVKAIQNIALIPLPSNGEASAESFPIADHTLYGDYPPKIIEPEVKPVESSEIVLTSVVIPEFMIVHDGPPSDPGAQNFWVPYKDYIKNVASSEIYATWPDATILANIFAIQSFSLNRVFTEWYRNKGYDFTITTSTAFDHKYIHNRNIYDTIDKAVDKVFTNYLSRPNVLQPILTQYCDGQRVQCPGVMTQWGSKELGEAGKSPIEILRNFYGDSIFLNTSSQVSGVPSSYPGAELRIGTSNASVRQLQEQLNKISDVYYAIPSVAVNGNYDAKTEASVKAFQTEFDLPVTGVVDLATWYKISGIYVAVTRIGEYQ